MESSLSQAQGISNFSSPSTHRLPTVSAAQALKDLKCSPSRCISTGLCLLDAFLQNQDTLQGEAKFGGISRGQVTDVYGPPGVGKTTFLMQLAANVLHSGEAVLWHPVWRRKSSSNEEFNHQNLKPQSLIFMGADTSHEISGPRFAQVITSRQSRHSHTIITTPPPSLAGLLSRFTHFSTPTLAHLIALVSHLISNYPLMNTSLLVIDSLSSLTTAEFPPDPTAISNVRRSSKLASRRFSVFQTLVSLLQKLAATRNVAVVVTEQCITNLRLSGNADLVPAINLPVWDQGLRCRLVLFRHWDWKNEDGSWNYNVRLAEVVKAEGVNVPKTKKLLVGFRIEAAGLIPLDNQVSNCISLFLSRLTPDDEKSCSVFSLPMKRKLTDNPEIADSDDNDEDHGWEFEDEKTLPPYPSQLHDSEDSLVGVRDEDDMDEEDREFKFVLSAYDESNGANQKVSKIIETTTHKKVVVDNSESEDDLA